MYFFNSEIKDSLEALDQEYQRIEEQQNTIFVGLIDYIKSKINFQLSDYDCKSIEDNFRHYLLDNGYNEKYSNYISGYVIANSGNAGFQENLNLVREGVILYQGIRYTSDINEIQNLNLNLDIFLSLEHLFNSLGYNGILYETIFQEFLDLVTKINSRAKTPAGKKTITLYYCEETSKAIDSFFYTAEKLMSRNSVIADRPAMQEILRGCKHSSDIVIKKAKFLDDLGKKGITKEILPPSFYIKPEYNVEDQNIIETVKAEQKSKGFDFDEDECHDTLKIFSKINTHRRGISDKGFEKIKAIYITADIFSLLLARNPIVKFKEGDIAFAHNLEFVTSKFWFKVQSGFSKLDSLPKSAEVITKAQIILAAHTAQSVNVKFKEVENKLKKGEITNELASKIIVDLKDKPNRPEQFSMENIEESVDFLIDDNFIETYKNEKELQKNHIQNLEAKVLEMQAQLSEAEANKLLQEKLKHEEDFQKRLVYFTEHAYKRYNRKKRNDFFYFLFVSIIILGVFSANAFVPRAPFGTVNSFALIAINIFLIIYFSFELLGRSFLFNKDRVKSGFSSILLFFNNNKEVTIRESIIANDIESFHLEENKDY